MKNNEIKLEKRKGKNKKIRSIINVIEYIIIFLVISVNAILIFKSVYMPNKTPSILGKKAFVIVSGSMIPEIQIGDVVIIKDDNNVKVGDIIAFRRESTVIVHRIIHELNVNGKAMYQTKGDNNNVADSELVDKNSIEGICIGKIPYIGKALMFLYNNLTVVIVIIIVILVLKYYLTREKE